MSSSGLGRLVEGMHWQIVGWGCDGWDLGDGVRSVVYLGYCLPGLQG